jgi:hypothetical protein
MDSIYKRLIKSVTGNGTGQLILTPSAAKRVHKLQLQCTYAGGTNTLAALMTAITEIRYKVGTRVRCKLNGTQLRDYMLLNGTSYDFNGLPNTGAQVTLPFGEEWFLAPVQDALAWNPVLLGGPITVEIDCSANLTVVAYEWVSDDLDAQSNGIITLEVIKPLAGGSSFFVEANQLQPIGRLIQASIYPDSTNSLEITPATLYLGTDNVLAHEGLTSAQNDEDLERAGLSPAASGRTANIYDMVFVRGDAMGHAINLAKWGTCKMKIEAGGTMAGTCSILLARLEANNS